MGRGVIGHFYLRTHVGRGLTTVPQERQMSDDGG